MWLLLSQRWRVRASAVQDGRTRQNRAKVFGYTTSFADVTGVLCAGNADNPNKRGGQRRGVSSYARHSDGDRSQDCRVGLWRMGSRRRKVNQVFFVCSASDLALMLKFDSVRGTICSLVVNLAPQPSHLRRRTFT